MKTTITKHSTYFTVDCGCGHEYDIVDLASGSRVECGDCDRTLEQALEDDFRKRIIADSTSAVQSALNENNMPGESKEFRDRDKAAVKGLLENALGLLNQYYDVPDYEELARLATNVDLEDK